MEYFIISNALGLKVLAVPDSRGICMGPDSNVAAGIDICADSNQYIDFTTMRVITTARLIYNATNNDF